MPLTSLATRTRQHGVAALAVVAVMFLAAMLVAVAASQALLTESRLAANQLRSTQAHQAAEAGLAWVLARLNDTSRIDAVCRPTSTPGASSFRARYLQIDETTGVIAPTTWNDAGVPRPLQTVCVRHGVGWTCSCPASGGPTWPAPTSTEAAPAFRVELSATLRPGTLRATATGCTLASRCEAGDGHHEAWARVEVELALMGGLRDAPAAALTVRVDVDPGGSGLGLHNVDPDTGVALHAGGALTVGPLRLTAPPGSPTDGGVVVADSALASLSEERFFSRYFGMDPAAWAAQPAVTRLACGGSCGDAVARAIDDGASLVAVDGDLELTGPLTLGAVGQPVAIVASGAARLSGDVTLHGLLFARGIDWRSASAPGALIRGAAVSSAGYAGDAAADIARDRMVLERLKRTRGSFARIAGSWKDF